MRLPFPEHIPLRYAVVFATLLCGVQMLQGTSAPFSLCCFLFILIATIAFNLAGGFTRPSGGYVFFYSILAVILGLFWKAFIGERADSNLTQPLLTIEASLGGITAMLGAVFLSRKLTLKRAVLGDMISDTNMKSAALGCLLGGVAVGVILTLSAHTSGSFASALAQLDKFYPVALILAVIYQIRKSGGTGSVNTIVFLSGGIIFYVGILSFSKQGMFTPLLCWLVAAASQRYRVSLYQVIGLVLVAIFMVYYLVPYSQYGRNFVVRASDTVSQTEAGKRNWDTAVALLSDLGHVRMEYKRSVANEVSDNDSGIGYFNSPQGLFDRLQMLSMDDAIINETEQNGKFGYSPIVWYCENIVPHFLWPNKPPLGIGNLYAHELGMLSPDDTTTGISFSPIGEAFHIERWVGIFIIAPILWTMLFTLFDSLCGDVRQSPWGLLVIVLFAHAAPEGMLGAVVYMLWYGAISIIFAAIAAAYVMPILGSIFNRTRSSSFRRTGPVRSIPRRLPPIQPAQGSSR